MAITTFIIKILDIQISCFSEYFPFYCLLFYSITSYKQRKYFISLLYFSIGLFLLILLIGLNRWSPAIGIDSLSELPDFDFREGCFFIKQIFFSNLSQYKIIFVYLVGGVIFFYFIEFIFKRLERYQKINTTRIKSHILLLGLFIALLSTFFNLISMYIKNSDSYLNVINNFSKIPIQTTPHARNVNVVVYIGESTSIFNMGLYGYIRNTTPNLDLLKEKEGLLVYENVFSTHTHTTPSLLEALSINVGFNEKYKKTDIKKRQSIVDLLNKSDLNVFLVSNQGQAGSWNMASSVIFSSANKRFSRQTSVLGNNEIQVARPFDEKYFGKELSNILTIKTNKLIFLHSYSGHGDYRSNIPEDYRKNVDDLFSTRNSLGIVGDNLFLLENVEAYDSAIMYIDHSVSAVINQVKQRADPIILIYFSDHGDSAYSGLGHDSSRFVHEMIRVPFIIYFNPAARELYSETYDKYLALSKTGNVSTLAQFPGVVLDLFNIDIINTEKVNALPLVGQKLKVSPIMVRQTLSGKSSINLNSDPPLGSNENESDGSDDATKIFKVTSNLKNKNLNICYHRSNTLGKALRGRLVANCLETDMVVESDQLRIHHPPVPKTDILLQDIMSIADRNNLAVWIDSKNLTNIQTCSVLSDYLSNLNYKKKNILVEMPSGSYQKASELKKCTNKIRSLGNAISYYVPTEISVQCSKSLKLGFSFDSVSVCQALNQDLEKATLSGLYSDISFDYSGIAAIQKLSYLNNYRWNTWNISPSNFDSLDTSKFRMVILSNNDPNNI